MPEFFATIQKKFKGIPWQPSRVEQAVVARPEEKQHVLRVGVGDVSVKNPYRDYNLERVWSYQFGQGQGGCILVADGIDQGGYESSLAAEIVTQAIREKIVMVHDSPRVSEAKEHLLSALATAAEKIESFQYHNLCYRLRQHGVKESYLREKLQDADTILGETIMGNVRGIGSTVSLAITCKDDETEKPVLLILNRGNSKVEVMFPDAYRERADGSVVRRMGQANLEDSVKYRDKLTGRVRRMITKWVRSDDIEEMRKTDVGMSEMAIEENMVVIARSTGWEKVVPQYEKRETAVTNFYLSDGRVILSSGSRAQYIAERFGQMTVDVWENAERSDDNFLYYDDMSVAVMDITPQIHFP